MRKTLLVALLALAACEAEVPMASSSSDASGRLFVPPPAGMGALYVYFPDRPQGAVWGVTAGPTLVGDLTRNTWLRVDLPAGERDVRCTGGRVATPSLLVNLTAGETRYIELGKHWLEVQCTMKEVTASIAQPAILAGKRVRELR